MTSTSILPRPAAGGKSHKSAYWLAALLLLLCASFGPAARAQQATAQDYEGTFGGTYRAAQGLTRVVIVIEATGEAEAVARYVFYPDNSNHNVPSGEFLLEGKVDPKTGKLVLVGKQWVEHPRNYEMVDVACTMSSDRKTLTGQVYLKNDKETKFEFKVTRWSRMPQ